MRAGYGDWKGPTDPRRVLGIHHDDLRRIGDIHVEHTGDCVKDRPPRSPRRRDARRHLSLRHINNGQGEGIGNRRVADIRGEEQIAPWIIGEHIRTHPDRNLGEAIFAIR